MTLSEYLRRPPQDRWCGAWVARWLDLSRGTRIVETLDEREMETTALLGGLFVAIAANRHLCAAGWRIASEADGEAPAGFPVFARAGDVLAIGISVGSGRVAFRDGSGVAIGRARIVRWWTCPR